MRRRLSIALLLATGALLLGPSLAGASSHREAPFITKTPKVDGADFYMFRSYEPGRSGYVTILADYLPLQDPYGGPNYFMMDPEALYEIHLDNTGDAREDLTFQFRFQTVFRDIKLDIGPSNASRAVSVPLRNVGPFTSTNTAALNLTETYTLALVRGDRRTGVVEPIAAMGGGRTFMKPVDNIGTKSINNYTPYAGAFIYTVQIPGCNTPARVFVGQRKDPFVANLGVIFDLIHLTPAEVTGTCGRDDDRDVLRDQNVTTLALELPISCITNANQNVLAGWTTASLRQARVLSPRPTINRPERAGGAWAQVSRLGNPLVNEVVIGLPDKDRFNASKPADDAQFATYVTYPTMPHLIQILFGSMATTLEPQTFPRLDLVAVFLTGIEGLNRPQGANPAAAELLRLNTSTPPTPQAMQSNLGVLGNDNAGFPNGRRLGDDVVDIELRVLMGALLPDAPARAIPFTDCATTNARRYDNAFPYAREPLPGAR